MTGIKAVIFDWGGVLVHDPVPVMMEQCSARLKIPVKELMKIYNEYAHDFQTNKISEERLWKEITGRLKIKQMPPGSIWMNAFMQAYKPDEEMFKLVNILKSKKVKIGLLSNTEKSVMEYFHKLNYQDIDVAVFSCQEGMTKPDLKIYKIILSRMKVKAQDTIFIDDRYENIEGAENAEMKTILFKDPEQVKKELINFGVDL
jgi:epoxide hydrolase-like predicted phosphatase